MARLNQVGFELQDYTKFLEFNSTNGTGLSIATDITHSGVGASFRTHPTTDQSNGYLIFESSDGAGPYYARVAFYLNALPTSIAGADHPVGPAVEEFSGSVGIIGMYGDGSGGDERIANSFVAKGTTIDSVTCKMNKYGAPTDNITCTIATALASGTVGSVTVAESAITFSQGVTFTFSSPLTVTAGNTYYVIWSRSSANDGTNYYGLYTQSPCQFADGEIYQRSYGTWDGGTASSDVLFSINYANTTEISFVALAGINTAYYSYLTLDIAGKVRMYDAYGYIVGSASSALALKEWHYMELKGDVTGTTLEFKIDGSIIGTNTSSYKQNWGVFSWGFGTGPALAGGATGGVWAAQETCSGDVYWDDIAINDTSGTSQTGYPGNGYIVHLQPNADGDNHAWSITNGGTAGAANNFTRIDEVTPDDGTSYNADLTLNDIDDYKLVATPSFLNGKATINVVGIGVRFSAALSAAEAAFVVRCKKVSGGTVSESSALTPTTTSWETNVDGHATYNYPLILYSDPDSAAWTKATLDTAQIGMRVSTGNTNAAQVSTIWLSIDFVPAPGGNTLSLLGVG